MGKEIDLNPDEIAPAGTEVDLSPDAIGAPVADAGPWREGYGRAPSLTREERIQNALKGDREKHWTARFGQWLMPTIARTAAETEIAGQDEAVQGRPELQQTLDTSRNFDRESKRAAAGLATGAGAGMLAARGLAALTPYIPMARAGLAGFAGGFGGSVGEDVASGDLDEGTPERATEAGWVGGGLGVATKAGETAFKGAARLIKGRSPQIQQYEAARVNGTLPIAEAEGAAGDLQPGPAGQANAARRASADIHAADERLTQAERDAYRAAEASQREVPGNLSPLRRETLRAGVESRPVSAEAPVSVETPATPVVARTQQTMSRLRNSPTVGDMLDERRALDKEAFGPTPTPGAPETRAALRQGIREASPPMAAADDRMAAFRRTQNRRQDILHGREEGGRIADAPQPAPAELEGPAPPVRQRVGDEQAAATRLGRLGDDSVEGAKWAPYLRELSQQDPAFARALDELAARKAWMATRFGMPTERTNLSNALAWPLRFVQHNAAAAGTRIALPGLRSGAVGARYLGQQSRRYAPVLATPRDPREEEER